MLPLGLIGAGPWGQNFIKTIARLPGFELITLASQNEHAQSWVTPSCTVTPDWHEVLENRRLAGVIIATPPHCRAEIMKAAIEKRIPILAEKPVTLSLAEIQELEALEKKFQSKILVDHIHLFHPAYKKLKQTLSDRGLSILKVASEGGNHGPLRNYSSLWDWGPHDLAFGFDLAGTTSLAQKKVSSYGENPAGNAFAGNFLFTLDFENEIHTEHKFGNLFTEKTRKLSVETDRGTFLLNDLSIDRKLTFQGEKGDSTVLDFEAGSAMEHLLLEFKKGILEKPSSRFGLSLATQISYLLSWAESRLKRNEPR